MVDPRPKRRLDKGMNKSLAAMCLALLLFGCGENSQKETWIKRIIETGLSERNEVLLEDGILDYDVYRDGKNDGVCYEYIVAHSSKLDGEQLKATLIPLVRTIINRDSESITAFESGIYFRFIYKSKDGRLLGDQIITSSDI
jgi:hypothetical protein